MAATKPGMKGTKRTRNGKEKLEKTAAQGTQHTDMATREPTPPAAQPPAPTVASAHLVSESNESSRKKQKRDTRGIQSRPAQSPPATIPTHHPAKHIKRQKLPKLPSNAVISKRPIHHPAPPTPFSSASPKTLYITASTPYIPAIKRIRKLLSEITKREKQSVHSLSRLGQKRPRQPLQANGRLDPADVEKEIVEGSAEGGMGKKGVGGEEVYLKATGRAIQRALEVGVHFQGENDCRVRVEMGSVSAIDDIELKMGIGADKDVEGNANGGKEEVWKDEDIPETRIRTLSSITVAIGLK